MRRECNDCTVGPDLMALGGDSVLVSAAVWFDSPDDRWGAKSLSGGFAVQLDHACCEKLRYSWSCELVTSSEPQTHPAAAGAPKGDKNATGNIFGSHRPRGSDGGIGAAISPHYGRSWRS